MTESISFVNGAICWFETSVAEFNTTVNSQNSWSRSVTSSKKSLGDSITGFSLTWDWDSDTQVSGSISVTGANPTDFANKIVAIYYCQKDNADATKRREKLATMLCGVTSGTFDDGVWSGKIELRSPLGAMQDQLVTGAGYITGTNYNTAKKLFPYITNWGTLGSLGEGILKSGYANVSLVGFIGSDEDSIMDRLKWCEGFAKENHVGINENGIATLSASPNSKSAYKTLSSGKDGYILPGIELSTGAEKSVNRVILHRSEQLNKNVSLSGTYTAILSSGNKFSANKTGRYVDHVETKKYTLTNKPPTSKGDAEAKNILASLQQKGNNEWTFMALKPAVSIGENITLKYGSMTKKGLCVRKELSMSVGDGPVESITIREW